MTMTIDRDSTEYCYVGITGDVPNTSAEVAFMAAAARPGPTDWKAAVLVNNSSHALWADAVASGATGDYYVARLVGPFGSNDLTLTAGSYQLWVRLTDTTERPIRISPEAVVVE